jgi:hypothetical protein
MISPLGIIRAVSSSKGRSEEFAWNQSSGCVALLRGRNFLFYFLEHSLDLFDVPHLMPAFQSEPLLG